MKDSSHFFPQDVLDDIATRCDIVSVVGEYVPLKKSGKDFKGLCPFHQEKSPSFIVSADKRIFHCFGCGVGGNVFTFIMKIEALTFPEAVERLARKAGIDLKVYKKDPDSYSHQKQKRDLLYKINRYALWYFLESLKTPAAESCRQYLVQRKIDPETAQAFSLGYAPDEWEGLVRFLKSKQVPLESASELGLIKVRPSGGYYDFFKNRLVFPIMDADQQVLGFSARTILPEDTGAKYINSAESLIYHKSESVYGLAQTKVALRQKNQVLLVEGNLDLIRLYQSGIKNVVAPLGTALTQEQVFLLKKYTSQFCFCYDGDAAGQKACRRSLDVAMECGVHPAILTLPVHEDPDSYVGRVGVEKFLEDLAKAPPALDWMLATQLSQTTSHVSNKARVVEELLPYINKLSGEIEQKAYRARLAHFLGVSSLDSPPKQNQNRQPVFPADQKISKNKNLLERNLLQIYLKNPLNDLIEREIFEIFEDETLKAIALKAWDEVAQTGQINWSLWTQQTGVISETISGLVLEDILYKPDQARQVLVDCLQSFKRQKLKQELKWITAQIHLAETTNKTDEVKKLLLKKNEAMQLLLKENKEH